MAKDWKQVAKAQKREIAKLKAVVREHEACDERQQRIYALRREMERMGRLIKRLEAKKA
jgi:type II secretory pathway component PulJ